jgi:hypothetical protein
MEPLGGRKPSELLASMLELCLQGHETSIFFTHLFLERLPAELRITLGEDDHQNVQALAKKADALWFLHRMKTTFSASVASLVDVDEPAQVAAVPSRGSTRGRGGHGCGGGPAGSARGGQQSGSQQASGQPTAVASLLPREMARIQSSLCLNHFNYGDKACSCTPPCNWGN